MVEAISRATLNDRVFAKPYFDQAGLILAIREFDDGTSRPLGMIHAGFAPNEARSDLDMSHGIISLMQVIEGENAREAEDNLLRLGVEYLERRGSKTISVGSDFPCGPFYNGIYGGSRVPGCLAEDTASRLAFERGGFIAGETIQIFTRSLTGFRPVVGRTQMAIRRQVQFSTPVEDLHASWWDHCTLGVAERETFKVVDRRDHHEIARAIFRDVQPLASEWGVQARGLYAINVNKEPEPSEGIELFLLGESMRHLMQDGIGLVEVQASENDLAMVEVLGKLGFQQADSGTQMRKQLADSP